MAIACHYDLTKLKLGSKLTKIIDTIYRKQWQEETSQVSQDKGLGRNCQGHPPTDFISHCFSLGTWFFIGSHNIRPGVEPIHVGRLNLNFRFQNHSIKFHPNTNSLTPRWSLAFGPTFCTRKHCQNIMDFHIKTHTSGIGYLSRFSVKILNSTKVVRLNFNYGSYLFYL